MKIGKRVRNIYNGREGFSHGPVYHFGIWWVLVEWNDGGKANVLEKILEVINEKR